MSWFDWHASWAHLVRPTTVELLEAPDTISIIGCDAAKATYSNLHSDERGVGRIYELSIGDGEWRLSARTSSPHARSAQRRRGWFDRRHDGRAIGRCPRRRTAGRWTLMLPTHAVAG